jgi:hypothetical protein
MKALMLIQHEIAQVHRRQDRSGVTSEDDGGGLWTMLRYVDLVRPSIFTPWNLLKF